MENLQERVRKILEEKHQREQELLIAREREAYVRSVLSGCIELLKPEKIAELIGDIKRYEVGGEEKFYVLERVWHGLSDSICNQLHNLVGEDSIFTFRWRMNSDGCAEILIRWKALKN